MVADVDTADFLLRRNVDNESPPHIDTGLLEPRDAGDGLFDELQLLGLCECDLLDPLSPPHGDSESDRDFFDIEQSLSDIRRSVGVAVVGVVLVVVLLLVLVVVVAVAVVAEKFKHFFTINIFTHLDYMFIFRHFLTYCCCCCGCCFYIRCCSRTSSITIHISRGVRLI